MTGTIKSFLFDKGYGFIDGDNGKSYFFHVSFCEANLSHKLIEGVCVSFSERATPRGYSAENVVLMNIEQIIYYEIPKNVYFSKNDNVQGWETIEATNWYVRAEARNSPDEAKNIMLARAERLGANAIVNARYFKTTGSEGNYQFSIHHYEGRLATIAKKTQNGRFKKEELIGLEEKVILCKERFREQNRNQKSVSDRKKRRTAFILFLLASSATIISYFLESKLGFGISAILFIMGVYTYLHDDVENQGEWLF